jgi:DNA-binding transcriptional ArsR family regulator
LLPRPQTRILTAEADLARHAGRPWFRAYVKQWTGLPLLGGPEGKRRTVAVDDAALARHALVGGATGSGKTRLSLRLIAEAVAGGCSAVVLDPKGETFDCLLPLLESAGVAPESVTLLDPRSPESGAPGWNPLLADVPLPLAVKDFAGLIERSASTTGPRMWDLLQNALLAVGSHGLSLYEMARFLIRDDYREALLRTPPTADPIPYREAALYFREEFAFWSRSERAAAVSPVLNKVRELLRNPSLRALVTSRRQTLRLGSLWERPGVVLVRLDRGGWARTAPASWPASSPTCSCAPPRSRKRCACGKSGWKRGHTAVCRGRRRTMAASRDAVARRGRSRRRERAAPPLTPLKLQALRWVAELGICSLPQLAALLEVSRVAARRHLRALFDGGLVEVVPCARFALADRTAPNDPSLLYGSAPNLYTLTKAGQRLLGELDGSPPPLRPGRYGPANGLYLAHELFIGDVRVWLELASRRHPGHRLERWADGAAAEIGLGRAQPPKAVRPDAWFAYRLGGRVLVGLLEADRGTERGSLRWKEKLAAYGFLFRSGRLAEVTGYANARVLAVVPDGRRRDRLAEFIKEQAAPEGAERFWLAERALLAEPDLGLAAWRRPGAEGLAPLLPPEMLEKRDGSADPPQEGGRR